MISQPQVPSTQVGYYYNYLTGQFEAQGGSGGAAAVQLFGYQASTLGVTPLNTDASGNLNVNVQAGGGGGGGGSNAAAGQTGSAVPVYADYLGFNSGGNLVGVSVGNPLPITGSISATNPSVSSTGAAAPGSATYIGFLSGTNLVGASAATPLPVTLPGSVAVTGTFWQATQPVSGTVTVAQPTAANLNATVTGTVGISGTVPVSGTFWQATQPVSGTVTVAQPTAANLNATVTGSVAVSNFPASQAVTGTFWQATQPVSIAAMPSTPVTGTFWQATQPVSAASLPLPSGAATAALQTTINTTLGSPMQQTGGSVSVTNFPATQPVSGTVNATVSGTVGISGTVPVSGTFWQATQPVSGTVTVTPSPTAAATPLTVRLSDGTNFYTGGGGGTSSTVQAAAPTTATQIGMTDGNLMQAVPGQSNRGLFVADVPALELLAAILVELRTMNVVLHSTLNSRDDLDALRNDPSIQVTLNS